MKVSVITVCFNSESTIGLTIQSVLSQTYPNIEYVLVDGGSKDSTLDIIKKGCVRNSVVISEPDEGIYDAMNKGVEIATGDVITFLNADDVFAHEDVVSNAVAALLDSGANLVFGDVQFVSDGRLVRHYSSKKFQPWKLRFGWMPPHPGSFARKTLFKTYGLFSLDFKIAADYEMFVRWLFVNRISFQRIDDVLVLMSLGGASTDGWRASVKLNKEIVVACRRNGIYTNLPMVLSKIPFKLTELFFKPS